MEKHIVVAPQINPAWRERVDEHLRVRLGPVAARLTSLNIRLVAHPAMTECLIDATTKDGEAISYAIFNSDPEISIADAVARLRRETARRHRLARLN